MQTAPASCDHCGGSIWRLMDAWLEEIEQDGRTLMHLVHHRSASPVRDVRPDGGIGCYSPSARSVIGFAHLFAPGGRWRRRLLALRAKAGPEHRAEWDALTDALDALAGQQD